MILNNKDINILNFALKILEIRSRFVQFGIMSAEEYAERTDKNTQPLVYSTETQDDDGMFTVFSGFGNTNRYYEDFFVRYFKSEDKQDDYIEIAVPVVFQEDCHNCQDGDCSECPEIGYYQLYLIDRDGTISEDIDMDECDDSGDGCCGCCDCECGCGCDTHEDAPTAAQIMHCRESGEHNLCNCECGEEHCFVECGPDPEAECDLNENGRCHCPHNRCCGCDCECEPDEED